MNPDYDLGVSPQQVELVADVVAELLSGRDGEAYNINIKGIGDYVPIEELSLEELASALAGITDPLGQLKNWLMGMFNWVKNQILGALKPVIDTISSIVGDISKAVKDALKDLKNTWSFLQSFAQDVKNAFEFIGNVITNLPKELGNVLQGIGAALSSALQGIESAISSTIMSVVNTIEGIFTTISNTISNFISMIQSSISGVVSTLQSWFSEVRSLFSNLWSQLGSIASTVTSVVGGLASTIGSMITSAIKGVLSAVESLGADLRKVFSSIASDIMNALKAIPKELGNIVSTIGKAVEGVAGTIGSMIEKAFKSFVGIIKSGIADLGKAIGGIVDAIENALKGFVGMVESGFKTFVGYIESGLKELGAMIGNIAREVSSVVGGFVREVIGAVEAIPKAFEGFVNMVVGEFRRLGELIGNALKTALTPVMKVLGEVGGTLENVVKFLEGLPKDIVKGVTDVVSKIEGGVEWLGKKVWGALTEVYNMIKEVGAVLEEVGRNVTNAFKFVSNAFTGFINAILKFPEWFENNLVKPITNFFKPVIDFFKNFKLPSLSDIGSAIVSSILKGFETIYKDVASALKWVYRELVSIGQDIVRAVEGALASMGAFFRDVFMDMWRGLKDIANWIYSEILIKGLIQGSEELAINMRKAFINALQGKAPPNETTLFIVLSSGSLTALTGLLTTPYVVEGLAKVFADIEAKLEPLGIGAKVKAALTQPLIKMAGFIRDTILQIVRGLAFGLAVQLFDPLKYIVRPFAKNYYTEIYQYFYGKKFGVEAFFESPTLYEMRELLRRAMVLIPNFEDIYKGRLPEAFRKYYDAVQFMTYIRGYPTWFINYYFNLGRTFMLKVMDRFGTERIIPFSPLFELPTHSEIIRMLQRDVFMSPMTWARFVKVYGMSDDLAKMFYMLSFNYPSFRELWRFMVRGVSGMLWYTAPDVAKKLFAADAEWLGAGMPVDPYRLNYDMHALLTAVSIYAKWIARSNFSWFRKGATIQYGNYRWKVDFDWTADSWLLFDISADIPGKVDARWMVKWALFNFLSNKLGVGVPKAGSAVTTYPTNMAFIDMVTKAVDQAIKTNVTMDLRPFCRLLVANGLHPAWVPLVAVAEAMSALADERTLLRTGFLNLFKEGAWDYATLDTFLNGIVTASFAVEWFDMATKKWVGGALNVPVKFLPAERRMLELRAAMDRANELIREYLRLMGRGVTQLIYEPSEALNIFTTFVEGLVSPWFAGLTKLIAGEELPLKVDTDWIKIYIQYFEQLRNIETIMRARYYTRYLIYSIMWRFREGWVSKEEMVRTIDSLVDALHESPLFKKLLVMVADLMTSAFERELMARAVINRLRRHKIGIEEAVKELEQAGMTPQMAKLYVEAYFEPYSVSLTTLATLVEVIPQALSYALSTLRMFGFNPQELVFWSIYVAKKQYMNETTLMRTRIYECLANNVPPEVVLQTLQEYAIIPVWKGGTVVFEYGPAAKELIAVYGKYRDVMEGFGYGLQEWIAMNLLARLEELRDQYKLKPSPYIPTPLEIANLLAYVGIPEELIKQAMSYQRVPSEWYPVWEQYFKVKPYIEELRVMLGTYVRAYAYGVVSPELQREVEQIANEMGVRGLGWRLIQLRAQLETLLRESAEYIPTPLTLASISEYIPWARELLPLVLKHRHVTGPWVRLWEEYVEIKPYINDVRELLRAIERLYERFYIKTEDFLKVLKALEVFGYEPKEIELILRTMEFDRWYYAFEHVLGTPKNLVSMAEYSPIARKFALGMVKKMIEALPIPQNVKELLTAMWEEYIRVRPVYDEVRRYVTELIDDVEYGLMTIEEFKAELEKLKAWGLDDYEIQFYVWLAQRRALRHEYEEELRLIERGARFGGWL